MADPLKVLVVDDSTIYRKIIRDVLAEAGDVEVIGVAANGEIALEKIEWLKPDLMTLDIEMPPPDGLEVLRRIKHNGAPVGVIMLSSLTEHGAQATHNALALGAFDFILKPNEGGFERNLTALREDLLPKIEAFAGSRNADSIPGYAPRTFDPVRLAATRSEEANKIPRDPQSLASGNTEIIVIGVSTGGPAALSELLPRLPANFPAPIIIVQHMPTIFTKSMADALNNVCPLRVREATDGDLVTPGEILVAPGGKQTKVVRDSVASIVRVTDDPPEKSCKPSVNYLFRSAAEIYGRNTVGVILTGMGDDGLEGCQHIKQLGGRVIAQDKDSCVVYGMPRIVVERGIVDLVSDLNTIPDALTRLASGGAPICR